MSGGGQVRRLDGAAAQRAFARMARPGESPWALFRSPAWFSAVEAWLRAQGREPVYWQVEGAAPTLLPLVEERCRWRGVPYPLWRFATIPDTQFADAPMDAEAAGRLARALNEASGWDVLQLDHLPEGGDLQRHLVPALEGLGLMSVREAGDGNAWVDLSQGWQAYYATRSRRLKKGNNHIRNRLERAFERIEVHRWEGEGDAEVMFQRLVRLSAASWKRETGLTFDRPAPQAFLRALFEHFLPRGELTVWWLALDGEAAAAELQLRHGGHVYALRADYDPRFEAYSPGTYLFWRLLQALLEEGLEGRYWMGPGENPYKTRWLQGREILQRYRFYRRSLRGRFLYTLEGRLKPWLKARMEHSDDGEAR